MSAFTVGSTLGDEIIACYCTHIVHGYLTLDIFYLLAVLEVYIENAIVKCTLLHKG